MSESPTAVAGKKEGQVLREVQRQMNLSNELREAFDKVEVRLSNVLAEPEKSEPRPESESPTMVSMAAQISGSNDRVQECIDRMCSILDRLEI